MEMVVDFRCSNRRTSSNVWKCQIHFAVFLYFLLRNSTRKSVCFIAGRSSRTCPSQTRWGCFTKKYKRLCVPLRPLRLNFKSHKVQEAFTAEDAEDFAEVRRGALRPKRVSSWYLPVKDALACFAKTSASSGLKNLRPRHLLPNFQSWNYDWQHEIRQLAYHPVALCYLRYGSTSKEFNLNFH